MVKRVTEELRRLSEELASTKEALHALTTQLTTLNDELRDRRRMDEPPAVQAEPERALDRPGKTARHDDLSGLRVLYVDDDLRTREAVSEVLELTGARVALAASAAAGIAAVDAFQPEVILCDIAMPEEDGYSFVRRLRARGRERGGTIPALALTTLATREDYRRSLAAGFNLHLTKPIDIDRLREAIRELAKLTNEAPAQPKPREGQE